MKELASNIILRDEKILLLYSEDENYWDLPGGRVKEDENPTDAAVRQAKKKIGGNIRLEKPFFSGEFQKNGEIYLWHGYIAEAEDLKLKNSDDIEWVDASELEDFKLSPNLQQIKPGLRRILK